MQIFRNALAALFLFTHLAAGWAGTPSRPSDAEPLIIGQIADLTGPNADFGRDYSLGAKLYFDNVNSSGGINGQTIAFRIRNSAGSAADGLAAARAFVKEGAAVLFGLNGDTVVNAVAGDPAIRAARIPVFGAVSGSAKFAARDGVFSLRASTAQEIESMIAHLAPLGITSISLASTREFADEANAALAESGRRHKLRIVRSLRFQITGSGPAQAAEAIAADHPQAVIVAADTVAVGLFFKRYRSLDQGAFLCTTSQVNVRTLSAVMGLRAAQGLIISQVVPDPAVYTALTLEHGKLMARLADEPVSYATLEGFIAAKALVTVLRRNRDASLPVFRRTLEGLGRIELGGYDLNFANGGRGSRFVDLTVVSRSGRLLR